MLAAWGTRACGAVLMLAFLALPLVGRLVVIEIRRPEAHCRSDGQSYFLVRAAVASMLKASWGRGEL